jgi:hypothetical protein
VRADWVSAVEIAQKGGLRALIARMPEILRLKRKEES